MGVLREGTVSPWHERHEHVVQWWALVNKVSSTAVEVEDVEGEGQREGHAVQSFEPGGGGRAVGRHAVPGLFADVAGYVLFRLFDGRG